MSKLYFDEGPARATGQKVCLATTVYEDPDVSYTFSIAKSREALSAAGIGSAYILLSGNCHVDDARNTVVAEFMQSDCTDLVFLDADVCWEPEYLVRLCQFDCDLVGGVYPFRREGSTELPVRPLRGAVPKDGLIEVEGLPTGFMRIRRRVFDTLLPASPWFMKNGQIIPLLFERSLEDHARWGGDINFCRKWRLSGGAVFAACELRLGHVAKVTLYDSLGAFFRRADGSTLRHIADRIRDGSEDPLNDYDEVFKANGNEWAASSDVLALCVGLSRKSLGPIIEAGSGLSTILMAAANPSIEVHSLEHSQHHAAMLREMAKDVGASNIVLHETPLRDGWYDISSAAIPDRFSVGICDGPPRLFGTRMRFFDVFGERARMILADDAADGKYAGSIIEWAAGHGRNVQRLGRAMLVGNVQKVAEAA